MVAIVLFDRDVSKCAFAGPPPYHNHDNEDYLCQIDHFQMELVQCNISRFYIILVFVICYPKLYLSM